MKLSKQEELELCYELLLNNETKAWANIMVSPRVQQALGINDLAYKIMHVIYTNQNNDKYSYTGKKHSWCTTSGRQIAIYVNGTPTSVKREIKHLVELGLLHIKNNGAGRSGLMRADSVWGTMMEANVNLAKYKREINKPKNKAKVGQVVQYGPDKVKEVVQYGPPSPQKVVQYGPHNIKGNKNIKGIKLKEDNRLTSTLRAAGGFIDFSYLTIENLIANDCHDIVKIIARYYSLSKAEYKDRLYHYFSYIDSNEFKGTDIKINTSLSYLIDRTKTSAKLNSQGIDYYYQQYTAEYIDKLYSKLAKVHKETMTRWKSDMTDGVVAYELERIQKKFNIAAI